MWNYFESSRSERARQSLFQGELCDLRRAIDLKLVLLRTAVVLTYTNGSDLTHKDWNIRTAVFFVCVVVQRDSSRAP